MALKDKVTPTNGPSTGKIAAVYDFATRNVLDGPKAWLVVICGAIFYFYQFVIRVTPNVIGDDVMQAFSIDASVWGLIVGFYYWAYSGMQLPLGISMDRWGPRRIIASAGFLCGFACLLFAKTESVYILGFARFLMGMGAACGFLGTLKLGSLWFSPLKFPRVIATTMVFGTLGANVGLNGMGFLAAWLGWQPAMFVLSVGGAIIGVLILLLVHDSPKPKRERRADRLRAYKKAKDDHIFQGLFRIIRKPQAWLIAAYGMLMYVPLTILGVAWGGPYLTAVYGDEGLALSIVGVMFIGAAVGSPFFTYLSDYLVKRREPMLLGAVSGIAVYLVILYLPDIPIILMYGLFFAAGFCYTAKTLSFAAICEIMPRHESGVSVGFANMVVMSTGVIYHPLIGYLLNMNWNGSLVDGKPIYSLLDYRFALIVIPISLALAVIILKFVRETHPGRHHEKPIRT